MKKDGEVSGAESTRSTSRTREKSSRSDKVTRLPCKLVHYVQNCSLCDLIYQDFSKS